MAHRMPPLRRMDRGTSGAMLVEVVVVIGFVVALCAVALTSVSGIRDRQRSSACKAELRRVQTAVEAYRAVPAGRKPKGDLPASLDALKFAGLLDVRAGQYVAYERVRSGGRDVARYTNGPKGDCVTS